MAGQKPPDILDVNIAHTSASRVAGPARKPLPLHAPRRTSATTGWVMGSWRWLLHLDTEIIGLTDHAFSAQDRRPWSVLDDFAEGRPER